MHSQHEFWNYVKCFLPKRQKLKDLGLIEESNNYYH